jgi:hypothetical protein
MEATGSAQEGAAKQIADFTFAHWTHLLSRLGRMDALRELFQQTQGHVFDRGPLLQVVNQSKDGYRTMMGQPDICFRCGTPTLSTVAKTIKGTAIDTREMVKLPSPTNGFDLTPFSQTDRNRHPLSGRYPKAGNRAHQSKQVTGMAAVNG